MIREFLQMGLLLLSGFGYWEYFRSKHRIHVYFVPVFTLGVQFSVLFAAGLLNCLGEAALLLHAMGFVLCAQQVHKQKFHVVSPYLNGGYAYFFLAMLAVGLLVENQWFTQIDNFTHWATVVRNMLSTDRFPTFRETAIEFTSYPLGSSALIYFICQIAGEAECMQMWAQAYLMLCALLPIFSCCRKNQAPFLALMLVMTGFLLHYNIPITELLVDSLMPLVGMAAALFVCFHCSTLENVEKRSFYYTIPLLIWTMNIKHAALIFVVFAMMLLYFCSRKEKQGKKQWVHVAGAVLLTRVLWSRHCDYVFEGGALSKHSMSFNWFRTILGDKSSERILETVKMALVRLATRTECLWLLAWLLLLGILVWFCVRQEKKHYALLLLSCLSLYGVYAVGIMGMYVFSMEDYGELLAFTRYMRSIDIAVYYMLTAFSGMLLARFAKAQQAAAVSVALVVLTAAGWHWQTGDYLQEKLACCSIEWRQELEEPIAKYEIPPKKKYLLCIPEDYHGWPRRIWRYRLETGSVDHVTVKELSQLENAQNYDYVVILDYDNPVIENWVRDNYPDAVGEQVIEHVKDNK